MIQQKKIRLKARPRGFHLITNEIIGQLTLPREGILNLFLQHSSAGITINENADPSVRRDIIKELDKIVPYDDGYAHSEGNSAAHIKASLMGFSQNIIIDAGNLQLGTWQGIYFCEFDGPRSRKVYVKIMKD